MPQITSDEGKAIIAAIQNLGKQIDVFQTTMYERMDTLETRMCGLEDRMNRLEDRMTGVERRISALERTTGTLTSRLNAVMLTQEV